jgi:sodium pump decarboxylase gamma subunit
MLWNLLTNATDKERSFQNIGEATLYAILGFAVVFVGIAFLIFVVWLVGKFMSKATGKDVVKEKAQPKAIEKSKEKPAVKTDIDKISEETLAVITAAIMAYYQQNGPKCEFTVKRIKRI